MTKFSRVATTMADSEWPNGNLTEVIGRQLDASSSTTTTRDCPMINTIDTDAFPYGTTTSTTGESRCNEELEQEGDFSPVLCSTVSFKLKLSIILDAFVIIKGGMKLS